MHGNAPGAGARNGNRNRLAHGVWAAAAKAERRRVAAMVREAEAVLRNFNPARSATLAHQYPQEQQARASIPPGAASPRFNST